MWAKRLGKQHTRHDDTDMEQNGQTFDLDSDTGSELEISCAQPSPSKNRCKRKAEKVVENSGKKSKINIADISESLLIHDSEKLLCIHKFVKSYTTDVLVTEYVDLFLKNQVIPILPDTSVIEEWLMKESAREAETEVLSKLTTNFISYLQIKYFQNNTMNATAQKVHMFNPKSDFWIPQFTLLPLQSLEEFTELKKTFAICLQTSACKATDFSLQLILLRNIELIVTNSQSEDNLRDEIEYNLAIAYTKAMMEFTKEFKPKIIDWTVKKSKIRNSLPKWRTDDSKKPPAEPFNVYAKKIEKRYADGAEKTRGSEVKTELDNFLKKIRGRYRKNAFDVQGLEKQTRKP